MDGTIGGSKVGITIIAMVGAVMALLDVSIVNVALNDIRASFGTPIDQIGWISTGYMMANIVTIPMTGWFQRRFGFRRYFTASVLVFTAASAMCGAAWNLESLVVFRVVQGIGGGAIIPTAQAMLFARYPREKHGMAAALFGLGAVAGPLLGPTVGGHLIDLTSWHWIFLINVPIGVILSLIAWRVIEEPNHVPSNEPVDVTGIALLAVGMASLQYVLEEGNRNDWLESRLITTLAAVAAIALVTFVVHELETESPVVDLRVFANRSYTAGSVINLLLGVSLFSGSFLLSLFCGTVLGYSALDIGSLFLVSGLVQLFLMPLVGGLAPKLEPRALVAVGIMLASGTLVANSHLNDQASFWDLGLPLMGRAAGMAFIFIPLTLVALSDLPPLQRGNATGLFALTRELGGSLGTAWMGTLVDHGMKHHAASLAENVTTLNPLAMDRYAGFIALSASSPNPPATALAILNFQVGRQALVISFGEAFLSTAMVFFTGLALVGLLKRPRPGAPAGAAH